MIILRKILFYVFLGIYLVLCPLIILYSLGYIYAPKIEEGLVKTGLIHLESLPAGAAVYLNNKLLEDETPCTLSELLPGQYQVRVQLNEYRPWVKTIDVKAGKASVFDRILLLPQEFHSDILVAQSFQSMICLPATRFLLLLGSKKIKDMVVFDWKNNTSRRLVKGDVPYGEQEISRYFVSKGSPCLLFEVQNEGKTQYLWFELEDEDFKARDISSLFEPAAPDDVRWEKGTPEYLFASYGRHLARLDLRKMKVRSDFMNNIRGYGPHKGKVYALAVDNLVRLDFDAKKEDSVVIDRGRFLRNVFPGAEFFRLDFLSGKTVFFISGKGELIINRFPYQYLQKDLEGYAPNANLKKVLIWTKKELGFLDLEKTESEEALFERGPEIDWFWIQGEDIRQAYFVFAASHALFCDQDIVQLAEIDAPFSAPRKIVRILRKSVPFYSEKTGKLYYLEPTQGNLVSLELIPRGKLLGGVFEEIEPQRLEEEQ